MNSSELNESQFNNETNFTVYSAPKNKDYIFNKTEVRLVLILVYTFVFACCFLGNILVIVVVLLHRRMRTVTNFFLTNLAFADLCVAVFCVYQNLSLYLTNSWAFGDVLCRMYHFVHSLSYTASIAILTVICVERYVAIVHPIWSKQALTIRRLRIVIVAVWLTSAAYCSPRMVMYGTVQVPSLSRGSITLCIMKRALYNSKTYDIINFSVCFILPMGIMSVMYLIIAVKLWKSASSLKIKGKRNSIDGDIPMSRMDADRTDHDSPTNLQRGKSASAPILCCGKKNKPEWLTGSNSIVASRSYSSESFNQKEVSSGSVDCNTTRLEQGISTEETQVKRTRKEKTGNCVQTRYQMTAANTILRARRKVIRLLIAVVLTFAICNLPFHARKMWQYFSPNYKGSSNTAFFFTIGSTLALYFNSGINPIIYAFLSLNFRKSMRDVLVCGTLSFKNKFRRRASTRSVNRTLQTSVNTHGDVVMVAQPACNTKRSKLKV